MRRKLLLTSGASTLYRLRLSVFTHNTFDEFAGNLLGIVLRLVGLRWAGIVCNNAADLELGCSCKNYDHIGFTASTRKDTVAASRGRI
jgi:hypothetical protein